jgi:hypothetical protein
MGQSIFLGNFDECIGVVGVENDSGSFKGQHCLVAFQRTPAQFRSHEPYDVPDSDGFREHIHDVADNERTVGTLVLYINRCVNNAILFVALRPNAGHGLLILEVSRSHTMTLHSR